MDFEEQLADMRTTVNECDRYTKVGFLPEVEASYLGLVLHLMDLTSLNSTDNQTTIENLVDKVITYKLYILIIKYISVQVKYIKKNKLFSKIIYRYISFLLLKIINKMWQKFK